MRTVDTCFLRERVRIGAAATGIDLAASPEDRADRALDTTHALHPRNVLLWGRSEPHQAWLQNAYSRIAKSLLRSPNDHRENMRPARRTLQDH